MRIRIELLPEDKEIKFKESLGSIELNTEFFELKGIPTGTQETFEAVLGCLLEQHRVFN